MATPYPADSMDATDDAEHFLLKNVDENYDLSTKVNYPIMNDQVAAVPHHIDVQRTAIAKPEAIASKKKRVTSLDSPLTSDHDSKSIGLALKPKKASLTLSGTKKVRKRFASYDDLMEGYDKKKLDLEAEKNEISRRKVSAMEKSAEYQHQERMEALSLQRLEAETRRTEAQSNHLLLQLQLENLKRQYEK